MLDIYGFAKPGAADQQIFYGTGQTWQTWTKPRGVSMIHILAIGAGGGGGSGGATINLARGGGAGGASAGIVNIMGPVWLLPDNLFIQPGVGGAGGISAGAQTGVAGAAGGRTFVSVKFNSTLLADLILITDGGTAPGGGAGGAVGAWQPAAHRAGHGAGAGGAAIPHPGGCRAGG